VGFLIRSLDRSHDVKGFKCANENLDDWLKNTARQHQEKNQCSSTHVLADEQSPGVIIGYYALAMRGLVQREVLPKNMQKALPLNVPAITLVRLAVSLKEQKKGHGERLLLDAMTKAKTASRLIGGSFLFVDAKDTESAIFYAHYGFVALPDDLLILCMPIVGIP